MQLANYPPDYRVPVWMEAVCTAISHGSTAKVCTKIGSDQRSKPRTINEIHLSKQYRCSPVAQPLVMSTLGYTCLRYESHAKKEMLCCIRLEEALQAFLDSYQRSVFLRYTYRET